MTTRDQRRWASRLAEVSVALVCVWIVVQLTTTFRQYQRENLPATAFFEVIDLEIPSHFLGDDPQIEYSRNIHRPFRGFWVAEVQERKAEGTRAVCFRPGVANYEPGDTLPDGITLGWFLHALCDLPPGTYRIHIGWDILAEGYPLKQVSFFSNWFDVLPLE